MNWIRDNKFLAGFLGVVLAGSIALAVLVFMASGRYGEVTETYNDKVKELQRLENLPPYPNDSNLKKVIEQKDVYANEVASLRSLLAERTYTVGETSPSDFQDQLRQAVGVVASAAGNDVTLPEGFYLGFDVYEAQPPKAEAAAPLARQLKSVKMLTDILIKAGVEELSIERSPLAEEGEGKSPAASKLVEKNPVTFSFRSDPRVFQDVLNRISGAEKFFIIRTINVQNEVQEGPVRGATVDAIDVAPVNGTNPAIDITGPDASAVESVSDGQTEVVDDRRMEFVVGSEKLQVTLLVEIVDFAPIEGDEASEAAGA